MQSENDRMAGEQSDSPAAEDAPGESGGGFPDRRLIDPSRDPHPGVPDHLAPEDVGDRPLIDPSRDPHPGVPDHAAPDDAE